MIVIFVLKHKNIMLEIIKVVYKSLKGQLQIHTVNRDLKKYMIVLPLPL